MSDPLLHVPAYRLHKARNLANVTIDGRDVYLGRYGSEESKAKYERVIGEWLARGRASVVSPCETYMPAISPLAI